MTASAFWKYPDQSRPRSLGIAMPLTKLPCSMISGPQVAVGAGAGAFPPVVGADGGACVALFAPVVTNGDAGAPFPAVDGVGGVGAALSAPVVANGDAGAPLPAVPDGVVGVGAALSEPVVANGDAGTPVPAVADGIGSAALLAAVVEGDDGVAGVSTGPTIL
jgi:hypothetical protein